MNECQQKVNLLEKEKEKKEEKKKEKKTKDRSVPGGSDKKKAVLFPDILGVRAIFRVTFTASHFSRWQHFLSFLTKTQKLSRTRTMSNLLDCF